MLLLEKIEQKRKYMILIMVICVLCGIACSLFVIPKKVTVESTLMLVEKEEKTESESISKGNIDLTKKMISNFEEIIKSESSIILVNEFLNANININELKHKIHVKEISNSDTFRIVVENENSNLAVKINNELIKIFSEKIETIYNNTEVYIVDNAHIEENINYSLVIKLMIISVVSGILISAIFISVLIEIDKKVRRSNVLESELALKNLGKIPLNKTKNKLINEKEKTTFAIAFRNLRSNIQFINVNNKEKNIILVTSSKKSEGKTIVSTNLAISFAKTGKKVILIDADMKSGKVDKMFNIPNDLGLSNYLSGMDENGVEFNERINSFIKDTTIKNLNVITSGTIPPNSSELLSMPKFAEMIKDLAVFYDMLIIDGTPILNATDGLILTRFANSTVIVSNYRKTKKDDLWNAKRDIQNVGGRIIGIIINKVKVKEESEKICNKTKKVLKEKYLKLKDYIVTKRENKKQKLLDAAIIEEKQKVVEELKNEENKLLEEIKKENEKEEKDTKSNTFTNIDLSVKQLERNNSIRIEKEGENKEEYKAENKAEVQKENVNYKIEDKKREINFNQTIEADLKNDKFALVKERIGQVENYIKEKTLTGISIVKEAINQGIEKVKILKKQLEDKKIEKLKEEVAQEKIEESKEIIKENTKKKEPEKTESYYVQKNENKDENSVLVIIDAENGYCRAFSQYCFTEKLIRGIDKIDGFVKANYSTSSITRKKFALMTKYELTNKQVERIDPLVYTVLQEYDDCIWIERKTTSNKAEDYVLCMAKDYERSVGETRINYELRCQYLRKIELAKAQIEIEYKLDNVWTSNQISFTDKIVFLKFAKLYENLKERKKVRQKQNNNDDKDNNNQILDRIKIKNPIQLFKKIKIDQVKAKSIEELTKEISETYDQNYFENYQYEDYAKYEGISKQALEEQEGIYIDELRFKQELKEKKAQEKAQKREERTRRKTERRKDREFKKQKAKEEARIEEELLEDNLYPKTKYNKSL